MASPPRVAREVCRAIYECCPPSWVVSDVAEHRRTIVCRFARSCDLIPLSHHELMSGVPYKVPRDHHTAVH